MQTMFASYNQAVPIWNHLDDRQWWVFVKAENIMLEKRYSHETYEL